MSAIEAVDLSRLPAPDVIEALDFEAILAARKAKLAELFPEIAEFLSLESEPAVKIQETGAYRELLHYARVNDAARAVMVAFARGADLDHLAALLEVVRLNGEDDERLRRRTVLAPESFMGAGPAGGLVHHAMTAALEVADVGLTRVPHRGDIAVSILSAAGDGTPSAGLLDAVRARLTRDDVKLMTDVISVRAAALAPYEIAVTLRILKGPDAPMLKAQARTALEALARERRRIGGSVYRTAIAAAAHLAGVEQVVVHAPAADIAGAAHVAPSCGSVTVETEVVA